MKEEELKRYLNQRIKLNLKDNTFFTGLVKELNEDNLTLIDKFQNYVTIAYSDISFILELNGDRRE